MLHYAALGLPIKLNTEMTNHYFWKQAAQEVDLIEKQVIQQTGQKPLIVGLSKWSIASALRFYDVDGQVDNIVSRNAIGKSATMLEQWTNPADWNGHPVIFVSFNSKDLQSVQIDHFADLLKPPETRDITLNNNKLRSLHFRIAEHYHMQ